MIRLVAQINIFENKQVSLQVKYDIKKPLSAYVEDILTHIQIANVDLIETTKRSTLKVLVNSHLIKNENLESTYLEDNDEVRIVFYPKIPAGFMAGILFPVLKGVAGWQLALTTAELLAVYVATTVANFAIMGAVGLLQSALMPKPKLPGAGGEYEDSAVYTWEGPQTSYAIGRTIPLIYGNVLTGGDIINAQVVGVGDTYDMKWQDIEGHKTSSTVDFDTLVPTEPSIMDPIGLFINFNVPPRYQETKYRFVIPIDKLGLAGGARGYVPGAHKAIIIYVRTVNAQGFATEPYPNWHHHITEPIKRRGGIQYPGIQTVDISCVTKNAAGTPVYYQFYLYCAVSRYDKEEKRRYLSYGGPQLAKVQYYGFGNIGKLESEDSTNINQQEALHVTLALSDGTINKIDTDFYINNMLKSAYGLNTESANVAQGIEIQTTQGFNAPAVDYEGQNYLVDLFGSQLLNNTPLDFTLEQGDLTPVNEFTYTTISDSVEGFSITIQFPQGLYQISNGEDGPGKVEFWIMYKEESEPWADAKDIIGPSKNEIKNGTVIIKQHHVGPFIININEGAIGKTLSAARYNIRVIRKTEVMKKLTKGWNETKIIRINEYSYSRRVYPNTAIMSLRIMPSDRLSGQMPNFNIPVRGRYVKVPVLRDSSNNIVPFNLVYTEYNSGTGTFTWKYLDNDGAEQTLTIAPENTLYQYTNCVPFIIYDLLTTQDLYPHINEDDLVWQDFIDAAEISWEYITTDQYDETTKEHRFEADIVIDSAIDAVTLLNQLVSLMRGKLYWIGNKLRLLIMKPEVMTQIFTNADIIPDTYKETYVPRIPNTLEVSYYDREQRFKQQTLQVSLKDATFYKHKIIKDSVSLIGTSRKSQALRLSNYILNYSKVSNRVIEFKTTLSALASIPGDVIGVQQSTVTYVYGGFLRRASASSGGTTTFHLDVPIYLTTGQNYILKLLRRTGIYAGLPNTTDEYTVIVAINGNYSEVTVAQTISPDYQENDTWMLTVQGVTEPEQYIKKRRILSITRDAKKEDITILCEPYNADIYTDYDVSLQYELPPAQLPDIIFSPVDVTNLNASQIRGTYDANVTYIIPSAESPLFSSTVSSLYGNKLTYPTSSNDQQLIKDRNLFVYDKTTGNYKGQLNVLTIEKSIKAFTYYTTDNFVGTLSVGDYIIQKRESSYLQINHVEISISTDAHNYITLGQDFSRGAGFVLKTLQPKKTYYVKAQSVAVTGTKSLNPPIIEFKIGVDECIASPTHLALCEFGEGVVNFTGCDVCLNWVQNSEYSGAGHSIEEYAGQEVAGTIKDYKIIGYHVWIYDNSGTTPQLIRKTRVKDEQFVYTHEMNTDDQYNTFAIQGKGQRKLLFHIFQEDTYGNVSCEPAEIEIENVAPSMQGYRPNLETKEGTIYVDWGNWINNPSVFPTDVEGYQVWYGVNELAMTLIDIPDSTAGQTQITGLLNAEYIVYVIPYDCFGTGYPRENYRSDAQSIVASGVLLTPHIPNRPDGMTGSIVIDSVVDGGTYYEIIAEEGTNLDTDYGFADITDPFSGEEENEYSNLPYSNDKIYYNTNPIGYRNTKIIVDDPTQWTGNRQEQVYTFDGVIGDLVLMFEAYNVNYTNEVQILVNGKHLGYATVTENNAWGSTETFTIPASFLNEFGTETNTLTFNNTYNPPSTFLWGLRNVSVTARATGYCYVTATDINTNNVVTTIYRLSSDNKWRIRFRKPSNATLSTYGYTAANGKPQEGQTFALNIFSQLTYEKGGGIWGGGVRSLTKMRWFRPHEDEENYNRLSHYEVHVSNPLGASANITAHEFDADIDYGTYETHEILGPTDDFVNVNLSVWSDSGHKSLPLSANAIYIVKETAEFFEDELHLDWSVSSTTNGSDIQIAIDNWDNIWQDKRIKEIEIFACLKQWNFNTNDWNVTPISDFTSMPNYEEEIRRYTEFERTVGGRNILINTDDYDYKYFFLGTTDGPIFHWVNSAVTSEGGLCENYSSGTCTQGCNDEIDTGNCPYGPASSSGSCCFPNNYYSSSDTSNRTVLDSTSGLKINYNKYFIAVALKLVTGQRVWIKDSTTGTLEYKDADFELIDRMHIKNAAITTAKIGNAMITNAKVKNLSADKVWIGTYPGGNTWKPFRDQCLYDMGNYCKAHEWKEGGTGYYKTHLCPLGISARVPSCAYTKSLFALTRIFGMTDYSIGNSTEWTYIQGGMIMTDTIMARSLQIGALPYVLDLQAYRIYDAVETSPDSYAYIQWHKASENPEATTLTNGYISFVNKTGYYVRAGKKKFSAGDMPSGTGTNLRRVHVAYLNMLALGTSGGTATIQWANMSLNVSSSDWTAAGSFSKLRSEGKLPLFTVIITKHISVEGEQILAGRSTVTAQQIISSDAGQFNVQVIMASPSSGTYIMNNDITTGVIHNEYWTSYFDMRMYTGYDSGHKGHGRLIIDGPSSFYSRSAMQSVGDQFGKEWWNYTSTWAHPNYTADRGTDTKFLIGRPYVDGIESTYVITRSVAESRADQGYLWFYKQFHTATSKWVGFLELGGKFRSKDLSTYRDVLIGQEYTYSGGSWKRTDAPGIYLYDIQALITAGGTPVKLLQLGGKTPVAVEGTRTAASYFNCKSTHQYSVCIDYNNQVPVTTLPDWSMASLLIISPNPTPSQTVGLIIRSPVTATTSTTNATGLLLYGNYNHGLYVVADKAVNNQSAMAAYFRGANSANSGASGVGALMLGSTGNYGTSYGVQGIASTGLYGTAIGGHFSAGNNGYGRSVAIELDATDGGTGTRAHISFSESSLRGRTRPASAYGKIGDFIASEYGLFYKRKNPTTENAQWVRITFSADNY